MSNSLERFALATRKKLRFSTSRGQLSVEQLWDIPLRSKNDFNLDAVAKSVNKRMKEGAEESFISTKKDPEQELCELALDVVKYVIQTKLREEEEAKQRAENKKEKERLMGVLEKKETDELSGLSKKELQERIEKLAL